MGDWAYAKLQPQSEETRRKMIRNEFGGINDWTGETVSGPS